MDMFPNQLLPRRKLFVFCTCVFYMLVATPMLTDGGMYLFQLFDAFSASGISLIFIVFCETIAIAWIYGAERVYDGINDMIGFYPIRWWKFCWQFVCPIAMIVSTDSVPACSPIRNTIIKSVLSI
ncbi:PREDICTED: sodium- and chloride-dependent GABA transporter 1-like [Priapulus caudatus]|uniref:Sodium- and chloride-dependent GABA transporter 1-like n=1 Tax=Priapulus caudatus TaxID=37621 RepID=A0ABM1E3P2_PRICU|nr:PREDICTED: sodium- and chloride-dependent GABA transporter 1-like [Priapulus caudatus]